LQQRSEKGRVGERIAGIAEIARIDGQAEDALYARFGSFDSPGKPGSLTMTT